jgi:hypothetical protein
MRQSQMLSAAIASGLLLLQPAAALQPASTMTDDQVRQAIIQSIAD